MSHNPSMTTDKFEIHYRQQLSALIDGELAADETRFLLRRLEHDEELSGCHERWQILGDVLRGAACAPAPSEFASRVREALAAEPKPVPGTQSRPRAGWRWSGGVAIAASVAALALFMTRERLPDEAMPSPEPVTVVATTAQLPSVPAKPAPADPDTTLADAMVAVPAVALASARRQEAAAQRRTGSATRTQQAARNVATRQQEPELRVASAQTAPAAPGNAEAVSPAVNPFAHPSTLQAKPWPRSVISNDGALNASFTRQRSDAAFYPFEPRLPAQPVVSGPPEPPLLQP
jgi:negative regulator of sigma E activity